MPKRNTSATILLILLLVAVAYALITLPPTVIEQYDRAQRLGPAWAIGYLILVGLGALIFVSLVAGVFLRLVLNARRKSLERQRRGRDPSQLSRKEREFELAHNLETGGQLADDTRVEARLREEIRLAIEEIETKRQQRKLEIVAFGTVSGGKSSLLNALAGREIFASDVRGGTTQTRGEIPWPGADHVTLVDTPGLAEVRGEERGAQAAEAARDADLVLLVVDGPLKAYEMEMLRQLAKMEKRILVCLNKEDWLEDTQRDELLAQIAKQAAPHVAAADVVAVRAAPSVRRRVRVLPDGGETTEQTELAADISPLADRMMKTIQRDGRDLLLANLLLQSRGLVDDARRRVTATLDARADETINKTMWAAASVTAVNPIPLLDLAGGSALTVKMVLDLAHIYRQSVDTDTVVNLLGQLGKNLVAILGVTAATPVVAAGVGSLLKTVPGVGTIAGGLVQGLVQAVVTRWIGRVFCEYFRDEMRPPTGGLAELAREKWGEVTRPDQLLKLIQQGRRLLNQEGK